MGYTANYKIIIKEEKLNELNLGSYKKLLSKIEEYGLVIDNLASYIHYGSTLYFKGIKGLPKDDSEQLTQKRIHELIDIYHEFTKEFKDVTNLTIALQYHDAPSFGDVHNDSVDGYYFSLETRELFKFTDEAFNLGGYNAFEPIYYIEADN